MLAQISSAVLRAEVAAYEVGMSCVCGDDTDRGHRNNMYVDVATMWATRQTQFLPARRNYSLRGKRDMACDNIRVIVSSIGNLVCVFMYTNRGL